MNPGEIQDLVELLIEIGGSLAEAGFEIAVRRATFMGFSNIFWAILISVVGILLFRLTKIKMKKHSDEPYETHDLDALFSGAGAFCCAIIAPLLIHNAFDYIINPKWQAVRMLMELITKGD